MKNLFILVLTIAAFAACNADASKQAETKAPPAETKAEVKTDTTQARTYVCPMDADITSSKADEKCSKCGMKLVEKK